jgi:putative peptide zinc metalloprotease protein
MDANDVNLLYHIFFEKLSKYGIVEGFDSQVQKKEKPSYLKLSVILLPENIINKITPYLTFLFVSRNIKITLIFSVFTISFGAITNIDILIGQNLEAMWLHIMIFGILSVTFHELGHVTAAKFFGAKHGGIGGGFYLFSPVFFADVTDIWKLPSRKRIVVNLAGIYFELIICSIYVLAGLYFHLPFLSVIAIFIVFNTLLNLNPFLRSDGYWILTDILEIPNR